MRFKKNGIVKFNYVEAEIQLKIAYIIGTEVRWERRKRRDNIQKRENLVFINDLMASSL